MTNTALPALCGGLKGTYQLLILPLNKIMKPRKSITFKESHGIFPNIINFSFTIEVILL